MKKILIVIAFFIIIVALIGYLYLNYKVNYNMAKISNANFDTYLDKDIYGSELATIINRAVDNNEKNEVQKNNKGIYINNDKNSINIEIIMIDDDQIYQMENFEKGGIENFIDYYGNIQFKCRRIEYHTATNKVKYMLFEQITQ